MKMKEFWPPGGGARPWCPPLDPPLLMDPKIHDTTTTMYFSQIYYQPQRSCGQGYVFTRVCDSVQGGGCAIPAFIAGGIPACLAAGLQWRGVLSQHALQVISQHALQQVSRGVSTPGGRGCLLTGVSGPGGVCSQGCLLPGGVFSWRAVCSGGRGVAGEIEGDQV